MAKLRTRIIIKHISLWAIWYLLNSLQLLPVLSTLSKTAWLQLAYNYISLIVIFYAVAALM
jgi:hypothetical protein